MRKRSVTQKDFLYLSISMFVIVAVWVGSNIYHAYVTSTINEDLQKQIIPISATFNTDTIEKLKKREQIDPLFKSASQPETSSSAKLTPTPTEKPINEPVEVLPTDEPFPTEEPLPTEEPTPEL